MKLHKLYEEQQLPVSIKEAWDFFSNPANLSRITPPDMHFNILTNLTNDNIYEGMQIKYIVSPLFGIPLKWITLIRNVKYQQEFVDTQLVGPYAVWRHLHTFAEKNGGVFMTDEVSYRLPLGFIGDMAHRLFVRKRIEHIFSYRKEAINKIFLKHGTYHN